MKSSTTMTMVGPAMATPLELNNPTPIILALINKLILCMLLVANSALFHQLALNKKTKIPHSFNVFISITFIFIACLICTYSTYEYGSSINYYIAYCEKNSGCLYTPTMLITAKILYLFVAILFTFICFFISSLLIYY